MTSASSSTSALSPAMTVSAAALALRAGSTSSEELIERCLQAATEHPSAFIDLDPDAARDRARAADRARARSGTGAVGRLLGVPLAVKDNIDVAGTPTSAGTAAWRGAPAARDADAVARLRAAGAVVVGKTNMHELSLGVTSANATFGAVTNPHDHARFAGGSSGGSAAAVAAGAAIVALGTDTGGSVRIPAALCGVAGLRPTSGRYPRAGTVGLSSTRDTIGPLAPTVADLVVLDEVLAGSAHGGSSDRRGAVPHPGPPVVAPDPRSVVVGLPVGGARGEMDAATAALRDAWVAALTGAGVRCVEVELGFLDDVEADIGSAITLYEARVELGEHAIRRGTDLRTVIDQVASPDVRALLEAHVAPGADGPVSERRYRDAVGRGRRDLRARLADVFHRHGVDVLLAPTTPLPAAPLGTGAGARAKAVGTVELDGRTVPTFETYIHHTGPMATAGLPGVTLPGGTAGDLPVGLALDALPGADRVLLAVALLVEEVIGA